MTKLGNVVKLYGSTGGSLIMYLMKKMMQSIHFWNDDFPPGNFPLK